MKVQYCSDLHLEFPENYRYFVKEKNIIPSGDILIIAGDLGYLYKELGYPISYGQNILDYLDDLRSFYKKIYIIPGNHEYYWGSMSPSISEVPKKILLRENVIFLNDASDSFSDENGNQYIIVGGTMWTNPSPLNYKNVLFSMNDYQHIFWKDQQKFLPGLAAHQLAHFAETVKAKLINKNDVKKIIVSHHCPIKEGMKGWYHCPDLTKLEPWNKDRVLSLMDAYCANGMNELIDIVKPDLWVYGHTHASNKFQYGSTLMVENSMGYVDSHSQNMKFNNQAYVEL